VSTIDWYIEGIEFGSCNCVYACPCQFEALPTHGDCRGFEVLRIDKGRFDDIVLDGLKVAMLYAWPRRSSRARAKCRSSLTRVRTPASGKP
jgi:hypothetical protein